MCSWECVTTTFLSSTFTNNKHTPFNREWTQARYLVHREGRVNLVLICTVSYQFNSYRWLRVFTQRYSFLRLHTPLRKCGGYFKIPKRSYNPVLSWTFSIIWGYTHNACPLAQLQYISFLGPFAKLRKATISFVMSVCPHGTTRLPLNGFCWNLIFETSSKICRENSDFTKIR